MPSAFAMSLGLLFSGQVRACPRSLGNEHAASDLFIEKHWLIIWHKKTGHAFWRPVFDMVIQRAMRRGFGPSTRDAQVIGQASLGDFLGLRLRGGLKRLMRVLSRNATDRVDRAEAILQVWVR